MKKPIRKKAVALFLALLMIIAAVPLIISALSQHGITDINNPGLSVHLITNWSNIPNAYGINKASGEYRLRVLNQSNKIATIKSYGNQSVLETVVSGTNFGTGYQFAAGGAYALKINKSSLTEGQVYDFSVRYTLDGVYDQDGVTLKEFVAPAYIGVYDSSNDSKQVNHDATYGGFRVNLEEMDYTNIFQTTYGILENNADLRQVTSDYIPYWGQGYTATHFNYNYYIDNTGGTYTNWNQLGFRLYATKRTNRRLHLQPQDNNGYGNGTISITGNYGTSSATIAMSNLCTAANGTYDPIDHGVARVGSPGTPYWEGVEGNYWGTLWNANDQGWFRFDGTMFTPNGSSSEAGKINFNYLFWKKPSFTGSTTERRSFIEGTINVYVFDKTELRNYVTSVGGENFAPLSGRYSTALWTEYTNALKEAYTQLAAEKTSQYKLAQAKTNLEAAVNKLKNTSNLATQVTQITHKLHSTDKASTVTSTDTRTILAPIGTYTVPYLASYKSTSGVNKCTAPIKTNYATTDVTLNNAGTYDYWKIDFSQVAPTLTSAADTIHDGEWCYTDSFKTGYTTAKTNLSNVDQTNYTATPENQSEVDTLVAALKEYIDHEGDAVNHSHVNGELQTDTPANCGTEGVGHYECTYCGTTTESNVTIPETPHDYGEVNYAWNTDHTECTASRVCANNESHIDSETKSGITPTSTTSATCTEAGNKHYEVTFRDGLGSTTEDVAIPAQGHTYGTITYTWSEDNSECTASRVCTKDESHTDSQTLGTTLTSTTSATCTEPGNEHYEVTFRNGLGSTTKDVPINALGHDQPAAKTSAKAATCMEAGNIEYWYCSKCDKNYSDAACTTQVDSVTIPIDPNNHNYGEAVEYNWNIAGPDDNTATCTATRTCSYNAAHDKLTQTVTATHTTTTEPDCENKGIETFTATFTETGLAGTTKKDVDISALGHDWGDWVTTQPYPCVAGSKKRTCKRDSNHTETETVAATAEHAYEEGYTVDVQPDCGAGTAGSQSKHCSVCDQKDPGSITPIPAEHKMDAYEYLSGSVPRFLNDGFGWNKCSVCGWTSSGTTTIPHMIDHVAPTAKMFLNGNEAGTNTLYIKDVSSTVEVTAGEFFDACDDEGNYGAGIREVHYHVSNTKLTEEQLKALGNDAWTSFYDGSLDDTGSGTNPVYKNVDLVLDFDEGATKYVYLKLVDHYDPQSGEEIGWGGNKAYISSPAITFDSIAPEVTVAGEGTNNKYCGDTTVTVTDATTAVTVTLDGTAVTLSAEGTFEVSDAGEHTVVATDAAGNDATATFTVYTSHAYDSYTPTDDTHRKTEANCQSPAIYYKQCTNCGAYSTSETFEYGTVNADNHSDLRDVDAKDKTCLENGWNAHKHCYDCGADVGKVVDTAWGSHDFTIKEDKSNVTYTDDDHTITCTRCDAVDVPRDHFFTETERTSATCTEDERISYECECGKTKTESGDAKTNHANKEYIAVKTATCVEKGNVAHWHCPDCGFNYEDEACTQKIDNVVIEIDSNNHYYATPSYTWTDNNATCTAERVCKRDGCGHKETEVKTGIKGKTELAATCTTKGKMSYTATFANPAFEKQDIEVETRPLGHVKPLDHHEKVDATCSETGTVEYWYCSRCKKNFADAACTTEIEDADLIIPIDSNNHSYGDADYNWADDYSACTAVKVCANNAEHKLTATATVGSDVITTSSCIAKGVTRYTATFPEDSGFDNQTAEVTDTEFGTHGEAVLLKEDNYNKYKDLQNFDVANAKVYKASTDEDEGYSGDQICPICGEILVKGEVTPPLKDCEHPADQLSDWVILVAPTCTHTGSKAKFCNKCKSYATPYVDIPKSDHKITAWTVVKDATCGEEGLEKAVCQNEDCKKEITRPIAKLTHNFSEWTVEERATCQKAGKEVRVCDRCGATEYNTLPITPNDHYYVPVPAVDPTCTRPGLTAGWKCHDCGLWWIKQEAVPATGHVDADKDGNCDVCGEAYQPTVVAPGNCKCICHKDSKIMQFLYKLVLPIWKLFKINTSCSCGHVHYE